LICQAGDDNQYGSSAVNDVACLQAISKRIHYGLFVAESKFQASPEQFRSLIIGRDTAGLMKAITDEETEQRLLIRVEVKAATYGQDLDNYTGHYKIPPALIRKIYQDWIIPLTKDLEVEYLLQRL
jgi:chorismate mutase